MNKLLSQIGVRLRKALTAAVGALAVSISVPATAAVIDFDPLPTLDPGGTFFTDGIYKVEAFWALNTGSGSWTMTTGHFHLSTALGSSGNAELQHYNGSADLQGILISRIDNQAFNLTSLDYLAYGNSSIPGFSPNDIHILTASTAPTSGSVSSQFTPTSIGAITGLWNTLSFSSLNNVNQVFISSSASVAFDNIVVGVTAVPEPASLALLGVGLAGLVAARRRSVIGRVA